MTDRSISFNVDMVCAILAGRKTQTRRPLTPQPGNNNRITKGHHTINIRDPKVVDFSPYGQAGDRLWVREAFGFTTLTGTLVYRADCDDCGVIFKPSYYMPREYSRLTLEVADIHVERLQDISEAEAEAEGFRTVGNTSPVFAFAKLWDSIYSNWDQNPWVWVVEFRFIPPVCVDCIRYANDCQLVGECAPYARSCNHKKTTAGV